jgi:hypothetical protein
MLIESLGKMFPINQIAPICFGSQLIFKNLMTSEKMSFALLHIHKSIKLS